MFPQFIQHPSDSIDVSLAYILRVDQDVIQVNDYKNVKFFGRNLIDVTVEAD